MNYQDTIEKIRKNKKVKRLDVLPGIDNVPYAAIKYEDKNKKLHYILVDVHNLYLLLDGFSITTTPRGLQYVIPKGSTTPLHQLITGSGGGYVGHHQTFSLDNRESSLQLVLKSDHDSFHNLYWREQKKLAAREELLAITETPPFMIKVVATPNSKTAETVDFSQNYNSATVCS